MMYDVRNSTCEKHDDGSVLVDRIEDPLGRDREIVLGRHDVQLEPRRLSAR